MKKKLSDIDKKEPFKAPEGYFDSLEDRIMAKISETEVKEEKSTKVISLNSWIKYAAAACIALLAVFFLIRPGLNTNGTESAEDILAEVPEQAIVDYLALTDISSSEIISLVDFTETDADSLQSVEPIELNLDIEDIDILIEEYGLIDLDSNKL